MCDFSLHAVKSRPAKVGDKLRTHNFGTGTRGFAALEDADLAICLLPGTELSFEREVRCATRLLGWRQRVINHKIAIFRHVNQDQEMVHHDALEFPDGHIILLTNVEQGQAATVLQLPAGAIRARAAQRAAHV